MTTSDILRAANAAKKKLAALSSEDKNRMLAAAADAIEAGSAGILGENAKDMEDARGRISDVMLDRLMLNEARIHAMAEGVRALIALPDPVGRILSERTSPERLLIRKVSVPLGVVAIIYESRPNVTSDAAALCLKSGNVCVLRTGKEAYRSSHAIVAAMHKGLEGAGFDKAFINILDDTTREGSYELMKARGEVDLLIPRGGAGLIRSCVENALVPCIETGTGICTVYVDGRADLDKALAIINNAKTQRPSVCNAAEICLVAEDAAKDFLPAMKKLLVDDRKAAGLVPVELRLCDKALKIIDGVPAGENDLDTEFLDYILSVKVVKDVREAAEVIAAHSTHHSEAIITEDAEAAEYFTRNVDSAAVYVNASTRFTDGGCFGLGCEMGISTQKLHARGPMGLEELNSYKYVITGTGQIRK
ncbi:MAG: glutamate-5-semialdehyde dehydrogenase [Firmicutes bacterium]|nr:glutamate-5-semialdehyde dehydrogenase [Bacillota bacterium]